MLGKTRVLKVREETQPLFGSKDGVRSKERLNLQARAEEN